MPLYEYECDACGQRFEVIQRFSDPPADTCRACSKGPVRRLMSSPAIQFKGTGWYITDYAKKGKTGSDGAPGSSATTESKGEGKTEGKTESKTDSKDAASSSSTSSDSSAPSKPAASTPGKSE